MAREYREDWRYIFLMFIVIIGSVIAGGYLKTVDKCLTSPFATLVPFRNTVCDVNQTWKLLHWKQWRFAPDQLLSRHFPVDAERRSYVRQVSNAVFSVVLPTPLKNRPRLAAVDKDVLMDCLDLDPDGLEESREFMKLANGELTFPGVLPLSHRYGGHQFGYWAGQLGDGRAVMLGEYVNHKGERWELQLKGSGLTPYSRRGDGKAVIRSSVREFLCSEAMYALGIPTSRAASLVVSDDPVTRDQFYNGNMKVERAAIVLRLAQSWFRFGSLEILADSDEIDLFRSMVDFIITNHFPNINASGPNKVLAFYQEVVRETAVMIAKWQSVGFTHGVCNTDNFSILSITIDYGPFGFLEEYDPNFVPNTSDDEGRYSYTKQPDVGRYNLDKLRISLLKLLSKTQAKQAIKILNGYAGIYKSKFMEFFFKKLGFQQKSVYTDDDEQFVAILLKIMEDTKADFTMTFRELSEITIDDLEILILGEKSFKLYWTLPILANHEWFESWVKVYRQNLKREGISDKQRQSVMLKTNPRYVLRNWIAQTVIEKTERNNFEELKTVLKILKQPFQYHSEAELRGFAHPAPEWSQELRVSCSS